MRQATSGPDSERKRQNSGEREPRPPPQLPHGVTQVGRRGVHTGYTAESGIGYLRIGSFLKIAEKSAYLVLG
jgi:hypothetical protein